MILTKMLLCSGQPPRSSISKLGDDCGLAVQNMRLLGPGPINHSTHYIGI